jgi:hypothetical protein
MVFSGFTIATFNQLILLDAEPREKKKNADTNIATCNMGLEKMFCILHHPMDATTQHTSHLENKNKRSFSVGIRWLGGKGLHTTRSIAQIFFGDCLCSMSRLICMIFVADLIACRM